MNGAAAPAAGATVHDAIALARLGIPVFRLKAGTKDSFVDTDWATGGATTDPMELYDRLAGGNFNIGCLGGKQVWVDIDEADGKNGEAAWRELLAELGIPEPKTFTVSTARGGRHLCFDAEGELFGGGDLIKGKINVRGCGGYVVGAGSEFVDKDGKRGRYVIIDPTPPAPLPDALKARLRTRGPKLDGPKVIGELDTPEAVALAENHAKTCPPSIERQGGDNNAIEVANRIYNFGISVEECTRIMVAYFNPRCAPPDADWIAVKCLNAWNSRQDPVGRDKPSDGSCFEPIDGPGPKTDGAPQRPRVQTIRISSLAGKPRPERELHVHNFIPTKNVTLLAGDGAVGKSLLAAQLAVSTALTKTWLRWQVLKPGPCTTSAPRMTLTKCTSGSRRFVRTKGQTWPT